MPTRRSAAAPSATPISFILRGATDTGAPGTRAAAGAALASLPAGLLQGQLRHRVDFMATRGGGPQAEQRVQAEPGRDVVVLRIAGGPALVLHPAHARDLMRAQQAGAPPATRSGRGDPDVVDVPAELRWQGLERAADSAADSAADTPRAATRGLLGSVLLAGLDIVRDPGGASLTDLAAQAVAARVDAQVRPGVYALQASALHKLKDSGASPLAALPAADGPLLVFIHGTFSNSAGGFGKLWQQHPQRVAALFRHYADRVYALDHPTLTASPIANALMLAQALPAGARLHLVTHSRGGLVAEVLARVAANPEFKGEDLSAFSGPEQRDLKALGKVLGDRQVRVERVVRVACPARGTLLASKRLDAYLSVFKWTLELGGVPVLPELVQFLAAVAQRRADVETLPGLAAQVPDSALIQWLHAADAALPGQLRVIAGDVQGDSIGSWLKTLLADGFYWTDNDFVVQTRSMYGGAPRAGGALFLLDRGARVAHNSYFAAERTAEAVCSALMQEQPTGFATIGPLSWSGESSSGTRAARRDGGETAAPASDKPAAILLPGICGSHLAVDGKRIWLSFRVIAGLKKLAYPDAPGTTVSADGAIGPIYDDLAQHLSRTHEVIEFSYDWRRPLEEEAQRLAQVAEAALAAREGSGQPVRFVAHSMGGLLVRTLQLEAPELFERLMARPGARLLMLGTPNAGSWAPMQVLSGDDTFGNTLVAFGAPFQDAKARALMAAMPGFLQLQAALTDADAGLADSATWQRLADQDLAAVRAHNQWHSDRTQLAAYTWGVPPQAVLDQALRLRQRLDAQRDAELPRFADRIVLVVGRARFTPDGFAFDAGEGLAYLNAVEAGDGRVTRASARLPGVRTWAVDCEHGSLPDHESAFAAYTELLVEGQTSKLNAMGELPPVQRGGPTDAAPFVGHVRSRPSRQRNSVAPPQRESSIGALPTALVNAEDVEVNAPAAPAAAGSAALLAVTVVNGNLAFNRLPLFLGHYRALSLTGTERVVDDLIGGTMNTALQLGADSYPEACGTHRVFVNTRRDPARPAGWANPPAAIVVGLGEEGKLRDAMLVGTVCQAVLGWLQREAEERRRGQHQGDDVALAATLLGSGGIGVSTGGAARAIVQGVVEANERVAGSGWPQVKRLELVELYLDRASEAWRELSLTAGTRRSHFTIEPAIRFGTGPLRRPLDHGYRGTEYDFVRVTRSANGLLEFALDSRRARTEVRAQSTQAALVDDLVGAAASDTNSDDQLGRTLFQLLVPPTVEPFLRSTSGILLEVDRGAAAIPWELLDTPQDDAQVEADEVWSLRTGLLRKLRVSDSDIDCRRDAIADDDVLVIGEPDLAGRGGYGKLPAALAEAKAVIAALERSGRIEPQRIGVSLQETARPVINWLLQRRWRIIHVSGHGEMPDETTPGGVVLSGKSFLGPNEIGAMRTVPELVFMNCCHLAALASAPAASGAEPRRPFNAPQFAATVAEKLIRMGVRCVIAAGWAVGDEPARVFASCFYERLFAGATFGVAIADARRAAKALGGNTWAAYQCYGDPAWRYTKGVSDAQQPTLSLQHQYEVIASPLGLTLALEQLAMDAKWRRGSSEAQLTRIRHLEDRFAAQWKSIGAVGEAFGVAYAEAGALDEAIDWFRTAVGCNDASASLKTSERLGSLLASQALIDLQAKGRRASEQCRAAARAQAQEGLFILEALNTMQKTVERECLIGSACRRMALIERMSGNNMQEIEQLERMETAYASAVALAETTDPANWERPAINQLAAQVRRSCIDPFRARPDAELLGKLRDVLSDRSRSAPDFRSESGLIAIELYEILIARESDSLGQTIERYADLQRRVPARSEWRSVAEQLEFVLGVAAAADQAHAQDDERERLLRLVRGYAL